MLVDDSRVTREVLKVYLVANDITVVDAADGAEALDKIRTSRPDLVLADLRMPRLDGCGLCEALKADPYTRDVPVIILTSNRDTDTARLCRAAGAREVLLKPIQPHPLLDAVNRHIAPRGATVLP